MGKRKGNRDPGGVRQLHPQRSFEDYVADATLNKLGGYIEQRLRETGNMLVQRQAQHYEQLYLRILTIESILFETVPGLNKETLAERLADIEDKQDSLEPATDAAQKGDRVRLELKTRTKDQSDWAGSSRMQVDDLGSNRTLGEELEGAIIGMVPGETKEIDFGKDGGYRASIALNRLSRPRKVETPAPAPTQEAPNASPDAG